MKNLPIGMQTLSQIRVKDAIYVDKTQIIHQLAKKGAYYFLSRPRRFGKSLLVSTIKELYKGNKPLFEGLWIYDKWDWSKTNPVIHISFDEIGYSELGLSESLKSILNDIADDYDISLLKSDLKGQFKELIQKLAKKYRRVVILIDEYDKPIIDFLESHTIEKAKENRLILRNFYSVLKNADEFIELVFITGISKFAQMSIFSHLNNLKDITMDKKYATLTGYTQAELVHYFKDYLEAIQQELNLSPEALLSHMAIWYNGYSWDGVHKVYNPFGTLCFLSDQQFKNYWFGTGSPDFLIAQMRKHAYFDVENTIVNNAILNKYDIENIELIPLLFQTGYLTVKEIDAMTGDIVLDYPNKEVRESMYMFLIDDLAQNARRVHTGRTIKDLNQAFLDKNLPKAHKIINSILADLPYEVYQHQSEGLFHGLIHLIFSYLGMFVNSEVHSSQGRADAVVETLTDVYIFEFKFNKTAQEALKQIHENQYADKYQASGKVITGIGVNFNSAKRGIDEWLEASFNA
jgi:Predicted AAA-ATPase/PD-(D/E)XK nuclease superfamily